MFLYITAVTKYLIHIMCYSVLDTVTVSKPASHWACTLNMCTAETAPNSGFQTYSNTLERLPYLWCIDMYKRTLKTKSLPQFCANLRNIVRYMYSAIRTSLNA